MIQLLEKSHCCGCDACGDVCHRNAITFSYDNEGFLYPSVDLDLCVNCGLCETVCPMINQTITIDHYNNPIYFCAYNKDYNVRKDSTSGGVFSLLAQHIYKRGGYVGGAIYNKDFSVSHIITNNEDDLLSLRNSKYQQSTAIGIYQTIKKLLVNKEIVLFCGLPCQTSAIRCFLQKDYPNLFLVDLLCKSCVSPKAFKRYLMSLEQKYQCCVTAIKERHKESGWHSLTRKISFNNGIVYYGRGITDNFQRAFQQNYFSRPSCYSCKFKGKMRSGDITIGDFWGIEEVDVTMDDDRGVSMICINNDKGLSLFNNIRHCLRLKEVSFEQVLSGNRAAFTGEGTKFPSIISRKKLFKLLDIFSFDVVMETLSPYKNSCLFNKIVRNIRLICWKNNFYI